MRLSSMMRVAVVAALIGIGPHQAASAAAERRPRIVGDSRSAAGLGVFDGAESKSTECYVITHHDGRFSSLCVRRGRYAYVQVGKGDEACRLADSGSPPFPCRTPALSGWVLLADPRGPLPQ
ncbi:MAG TPA: hypothetical protein VG248_19140 [Caulobacteraceae bacterium]|nr:hypothetical protein [Caulobacteraceae bacterium]